MMPLETFPFDPADYLTSDEAVEAFLQDALDSNEPIEIAQRIIVNFFTAKRLLMALHMAVQRHEAAFGVLETDVQKRVVPGASGGARTSS